jgi:hypothetical protein
MRAPTRTRCARASRREAHDPARVGSRQRSRAVTRLICPTSLGKYSATRSRKSPVRSSFRGASETSEPGIHNHRACGLPHSRQIKTAFAACRIRGKLKEARSVVLFARMAQGPSAPAIIGHAGRRSISRAAVVMDSGLSPCGLPRNDDATDLPDGQICLRHFRSCPVCPDPIAKRFIFLFFGNWSRVTLSRLEQRGVRVVTNVGRDAMDADARAGRAARLADCEVVWSWRPWAGAKRAGWRCRPLQARHAVICRRR